MINAKLLKDQVKDNMELFNLPAPTTETLNRMQYMKEIINTINFITEKYHIGTMDEVITNLKGLVNVKSKPQTTELENHLLETFTMEHIQSIATQTPEEILQDMYSLASTRRFTELPNIEGLLGVIIDDVVSGTRNSNKIFMKDGGILKEIVKIQQEISTKLKTDSKKFLLIDTETNSLPNKRRADSGLPIQIAYILTDDRLEVIKRDNFYIKQKWIDAGAESVHKISVGILETLSPVSPEEGYDRIRTLLENKDITLVAHNASFDIGVLKRLKEQAERNRGEGNELYIAPNFICTLSKARKEISKAELASKKLMDVVNYFGKTENEILIKTEEIFGAECGAHDARYDTVALLELAKAMGISK